MGDRGLADVGKGEVAVYTRVVFPADGALVEGAGQVAGPVGLVEVGECVGRT